MNNGGYPTEKELKLIKEWPHTDFTGLIDFIVETWWCKYGISWTKRRVKAEVGNDYYVFRCSTGGWSGNEDIIDALAENRVFWSLCFWSHRRGGHYVFHLPIFNQ